MRTISLPDPENSMGRGGGDIHVTHEGNLALVDELTSVEQRVLERLRFWRNEWFLGFNDGVPYLSEIFERPITVGLASTILASEAMKVTDVLDVYDIEAEIDPATRTLIWSATIRTEFGNTSLGVTVP